MWPALVMALLLAAVFHWGVASESVSAQGGRTTLGVVVSREGLSVSEGSSGSYSVRFSAAPEARVVIQPEVAGSPTGLVVTVAPSTLVFTPSDWRRSQRVHVSVSQKVTAPTGVERDFAPGSNNTLFTDRGVGFRVPDDNVTDWSEVGAVPAGETRSACDVWEVPAGSQTVIYAVNNWLEHPGVYRVDLFADQP